MEGAPTDRGNKQSTFKALADDFKMDEKVLALLMSSPMENLEDFRFYFTEEKDIDNFVAEDKDLKDSALRLQVARFRRAWSAVRQGAIQKESKNSISTVAELDDLLEETDLRGVKVQFWKRYKLRYPADIMPSDQIISRCYREADKRLLTVFDVWRVRSLKHQVTTTRKRKQVGDGLFTFEEDNNVETHHNANAYLARLHIYLLAIAITGSVKKSGAPIEETFGSDSVEHVAAPWDVLQAYYFRAVESAAAIPEASRLAWLQRTDTAERAVWVSTFRDGEATIGMVIKQTMDRRGAHWDPPAAPIAQSQYYQSRSPEKTRGPGRPGKGGQQQGSQGQSQQQGAQGGKQQQGKNGDLWSKTPGEICTELKDGKKLCADWQTGSCRTRGLVCAKGLHKCGKVNPRGRICGMNFHGAHQCRAK